MKKVLIYLFMAIGGLVFGSCSNRIVHSEFHTLSLDGWHQDSILSYSIEAKDTAACHDVLIVLRHTTQYPYQNLWLFVDEYMGGILLKKDTIEATLADDYGRWLGNGINRYELPLLYADDYYFSQLGEYKFTIQQGMRSDWLKGIIDVGLVIQQNDGKE